MPEDGEYINDKWIKVKGKGKIKNLLNPKPNPTKCIMHLPYCPNLMPLLTTTCSARHNKLTTTKPSYPLAHKSAAGSKKMPGASTSNKHYGGYTKVMIFLLTTASPTPRMNAQPSPRMTLTMQSMWQSIPPMHNVTNQPLGSTNMAGIQPTAWAAFNRTIKKRNKNKHVNFAKQNKVHLFDATSTPSIILTYNSGANGHYISKHDQRKAGLPILRPSMQRQGCKWGHKQRQIHHPAPLLKTIRMIKISRHIPGLLHISDKRGQNIKQWHSFSLHEGGRQRIQGRRCPHNMQRGTNPHPHQR
jgi:hypothetical protein